MDRNLHITQIKPTTFRLPMHGELRWGKASTLAEARHVLVQVTLSDGSTGYAEAPPRPTIYGETVYSITSIIEHELAIRKMYKYKFAQLIGEYPQVLSSIIKGHRSLNIRLALRMEEALGWEEGTLMVLQVYYEIAQVKKKSGKDLNPVD